MNNFYDHLAPFYHILYKNWGATVEEQATQLSNIIREYWDGQVQSIVDVTILPTRFGWDKSGWLRGYKAHTSMATEHAELAERAQRLQY